MKFITAVAIAVLIPTSIALKKREYTATYDENEVNSGFYGVNITGSYNGLHYTNWYSGPFDYEAGFCAGVCPESFPAEAAFDGGKQASISASYVNSTVEYFNLRDFYFGCNAVLNTTYEGREFDYPTPENCTLHVSGHLDKHLPATAFQTFKYTPAITPNPNTGAPMAPMTHAVFNTEFQQLGIRYVVFTATAPKTGYVPQLNESFPLINFKVLVDNLHYFTYSSK